MKMLKKYFAAAFVTAAAAVTALAFSASAGWFSDDNDNPSGYTYATTDFTVWVNGKDIKDNAKTPEDETCLNKIGVLQHYAMSGGGKWNVAVTAVNINTPEKFLALCDDKGKVFDPRAADNKLIAAAKIKDGEITVTAGKNAGQVVVWVYETNKNGVVYIPTRNVVPSMYTVNVKMAPGSPVLAEPSDVTGGVLNAGAKAITKLALGYDAASYNQDSAKLALCDKKTAADISADYTVTYSNSDKTTTPTVVSVSIATDNSTVYVTPLSMGKSTVSITSNQSGKVAKLTVEVKSKYKVNYDARFVKVEDMTDKNNPVEIASGSALVDGTTVRISVAENASVDQIMAYGKSVKSGATVKVTGADLDIIAGKLYELTVKGADKSNMVLDGTKVVSSGKYLSGTKLSIVVAKDHSAKVKNGNREETFIGDGVSNYEITIEGDISIEFVKPETSAT